MGKYEKLEKAVYDIADLLMLLRTYCEEHKDDSEQMTHIHCLTVNIHEDFVEKIASKF